MERKLIYDIGLHKGEDTEYYLARGYKVIAVEADPDLVLYCKKKFDHYLKSGELVIIHGAVIENENQDFIKFYKNSKVSVWGTVVKEWADRNTMLGANSIEIEVPVVNFNSLFLTYGCPYYLKIDIEGMDMVCLRKLFLTDLRPKYISIESEKANFSFLVEELSVLQSLGYKKFFVKQQSNMAKNFVPLNTREGPYVNYQFVNGSTGLFGSDLGSDWIDLEEALNRYKKIFKEYKYFGDSSLIRRAPFGRHFLYILSKIVGRPLPGWYDTHASLH